MLGLAVPHSAGTAIQVLVPVASKQRHLRYCVYLCAWSDTRQQQAQQLCILLTCRKCSSRRADIAQQRGHCSQSTALSLLAETPQPHSWDKAACLPAWQMR